jgi:predicted lipoprotein
MRLKTIIKTYIMLIVFVSMAGLILSCASTPQRKWYKPNFTKQEFARDKYDCMQQSQQSQSSAMGAYCVGYYCQPDQAQSSVVTNWDLFNACMEARGWSLVDEMQQQPNPPSNQPLNCYDHCKKRQLDYGTDFNQCMMHCK